MSAAEAIEAARAAGIHIAIDGDDLVLEASAPPSPVVVDLLSRHKARVVAMLRRQQEVREFGPDTGSWHAEALRCRIVAELERLPATRDDNGRQLIAETWKFLNSPWFSAALLNGWSLETLFGVDSGAPLDNFECWGLIVGLALAPRDGDAIEQIDAKHVVIRYYAGPTMKTARRIERLFLPTATTVPWWQSTILVGDVC